VLFFIIRNGNLARHKEGAMKPPLYRMSSEKFQIPSPEIASPMMHDTYSTQIGGALASDANSHAESYHACPPRTARIRFTEKIITDIAQAIRPMIPHNFFIVFSSLKFGKIVGFLLHYKEWKFCEWSKI
jgi:hypothetical protein